MRPFRGTIIISIEQSQSSILSTVLYIFQQLHMKQLVFPRKICFRTPYRCLEQLLLSNNYFLITVTFQVSYFLKINTFSAQLLLRRSYFFRKSNYSEHVIFRSRCLFRTATFSEEQLFQEHVFLENSYFFGKASSG